ncbi:hypothetical protein [Elizabethkingia anophelis]|uniref:hypothetical protein n=1 Tax=Elizabethkingia anophelis TaxID=1117645 RepID=UPI003787048E
MNSQNKQQAIKAAYGEFWERLSPFQQEYALSENGTVEIGYTEEQKKLFSDIRKSGLFNFKPTMPKSLSGIETNNSWTRIESEEDLPKDDYFGDLFEVGFLDESGFFHHDKKRCSFKSLKWMYEKKLITHYQPIETPKPPIF